MKKASVPNASKPRCLRRVLFFLAASAMLYPAVSVDTAPQTLSISVVPQFRAVDSHRSWAPFLARLSSRTGIEFKLKYYPTIPKFEEGFLRGDTDLVYMNPYHAVMAKRAQGYVPLVRGPMGLRGILVVRADSSIHSVEQIKGSAIAFPSANAFAASLYMRALLTRAGVHFTPRYVHTHQNVYRSVVLGVVQAGGGIRDTLTREPETIRSQLRVVFETQPVVPHPLTVHPRVPTVLQARVTAAILDMHGASSEDRELLAGVGLSRPELTSYALDYAPLESYQLEHWVEVP